MISQKVSLTLAFVLITTIFATSQVRKEASRRVPPSAFKLVALKVTGTTNYSDKEILAATGLQLGQTVSEEDFKKAAQQLGDSGLFRDIAYTYQYSPDGTEVRFQLADSDKLLPVRFDNFVWFSDQELLSELQKRVPLFKGKLPLGGSLADDISQALQVMLIERKIEGRADYIRQEKDDKIVAFDFSVTGPEIKIQKITFTGAGAAELPRLEAASREIVGSDYLQSLARLKSEKVFLPIYHQHGYLKAEFSDPQVKVTQQTPQETDVELSFAVTPGQQYRVDDIQLSGYKAFPVEKLRPLLRLTAGQIADSVKLDQDIQAIRELYGTKGYMGLKVNPVPEFDDTLGAVKFLLEFNEGDVYKMGDLDIRGLDSRTTDRLKEAWKIRGGDPYDSSYPKEFVKEAMKELSLMGNWVSHYRQSVNEKDKTVDVSIRFDPESR